MTIAFETVRSRRYEAVTADGATLAVARFVRATSYASIPAQVRESARQVMADTVAVMLAAARSEVGPPLREYLGRNPAPGAAPVIGWPDRVAPEIAAMINGTLGHALDYDESTSLYPAHPSGPILAALLSCQEPAALDGQALLTAYVTGFQSGGLIARAVGLSHYLRGWHATGTLALFAAVAALAKARDLAEDEICTALGIAASLSAGMTRNFGTMTKPLHPGWAARSALVAVELASVGWTANQQILEIPRGYLSVYGDESSDPTAAVPEYTVPWIFASPGVALKKYPCCYATHRAIDAVLALRAELGAGRITSLACRVPPGGLNQLPYGRPATALEGKFSAPYACAAALLDGQVTLDTFTEEAVMRPQIAALYPVIDIREDPACLMDGPVTGDINDGYVEVTATTATGQAAAVRVHTPSGSPEHPMGWDEIAAKFGACCQSVLMDATESGTLFAELRHIDEQPDVRALIAGIKVGLYRDAGI
jgi:2-methylcitrate dehydratase PrpD